MNTVNMTELLDSLETARIYAGTINKKGDMWINKTDVTDEALWSVASYLLDNDEIFVFTMKGKKYRLYVADFNVGKMAESEEKGSESK